MPRITEMFSKRTEDFFSDDLLESVKLEELNMNLEET